MQTKPRNSTPTARIVIDDRRVCLGSGSFLRRPTGSAQPVWIRHVRR